jgi:hypothetical protein
MFPELKIHYQFTISTFDASRIHYLKHSEHVPELRTLATTVALPHEYKICGFHIALLNQYTKARYYTAISNFTDIDGKVFYLQKLVSLICSVHITAHQVIINFTTGAKPQCLKWVPKHKSLRTNKTFHNVPINNSIGNSHCKGNETLGFTELAICLRAQPRIHWRLIDTIHTTVLYHM